MLLSNQGTKFERKTDIANCLMARDYKGLGNQIGNGIMEKLFIPAHQKELWEKIKNIEKSY